MNLSTTKRLVYMKKFPLHFQIILTSILGVIVGVACNQWGGEASGFFLLLVELNQFIGDVFLRALRFVAVPIVFFSLVAGVGSLQDTRKLGRIASRSIGIYLLTTAVAISIGVILANVLKPGSYVPVELQAEFINTGKLIAMEKMNQAQSPNAWATLLNIIPKNPFSALASGNMLQIVFFSLMVGMGLSGIAEEKAKPVLGFFEAMTEVIITIVHWIMKIAPIAVFSLLAKVTADLGFEVLQALLAYSLVVLGGLGILLFIVYPFLAWRFAGLSIKKLFSAISPAQLLAFSSSSSSATMPVTLDCVENRLKIDKDVSRFVIPLGATINMDGTALYQGVAAIFIAQVYGIELDVSQQLTIIFTATLASIGTAGVPGVGLIMLVVVLQSIGLSTEQMSGGLAIIFGVDRLLDMSRTVINVTGDCTVAAIVSSWEKKGVLSE